VTAAARFERLYRDSPDPWGYDTSEYEREKYEATLAALPEGPIGSCLEIGCSIGAFTRLLADRCEHVVAIDFSLNAIRLAARRLETSPNVELLRAAFPEETPPGSWDAVVCSELLYYLQPPQLDEAIEWLQTQLIRGATVLAVSWRGRGVDEPFRGDDVHDRLVSELGSWHALDERREGYRLDRFDGR
jgi:SAM-dependent methyltransferase